MFTKLSCSTLVYLLVVSAVTAQTNRNGWRGNRAGTIKTTESTTISRATSNPTARVASRTTPSNVRVASGPLKPISTVKTTGRVSIARVTKGTGTLPNDQGQIWREYDISPYTLRVTTTKRPESAIVDWILRETGWEAWHSDTISILNADRRTLRVYHTPEMHKVVSEIVDRFVNSEAESQGFSLRVVTIGNPNWRANVKRMLKPIPVQSQGVQAWLVSKEDAALLVGQLRKRSDFREYTSPHMLIHNGQSKVVGTSRPRKYHKNIIPRPDTTLGFEIEEGIIDEGFSLEFNPLLSLDGKTIDAVVKVNITQVEKMIPVTVSVPSRFKIHQQQQIQIPQTANCNLHERFRWPTDKVLLVSRGVVATPVPKGKNMFGLDLSGNSGSRADALLFIENKGKVLKTSVPKNASRTAIRRPLIYQHRR